ncbi:cysteine-rich CWC family protein [Acetobacter aceti]|uniref:cysteine-rich CWC family protein n=1 Tax=Acetobacter aceti TaxID=435 RepID=UPI000A8BCBF1
METRCARCNAPLECLASADCWCMKLPPELPVPPENLNSGCLCPACLAAAFEVNKIHKLQQKPET